MQKNKIGEATRFIKCSHMYWEKVRFSVRNDNYCLVYKNS